MTRRFFYGLMVLLIVGCGVDKTIYPTTEQEEAMLNDYSRLQMPRSDVLTLESEPGEKLILCFEVLDRETGEPLGMRRLWFAQPDSLGEFGDFNPSNMTTTRINGHVITNNVGKSMVQTILPGEVDGIEGNRFIYVNVNRAEESLYQLFFKQYSSASIRRMTSRDTDKILVDLKRTRRGDLVGFVTVDCKWGEQTHFNEQFKFE